MITQNLHAAPNGERVTLALAITSRCLFAFRRMPLALRSQEVALRENAVFASWEGVCGGSRWPELRGRGQGRGGCSGWDAGRCVEFWEGLDVGRRPRASSLGRKAGQGPWRPPPLPGSPEGYVAAPSSDYTTGLLRGPQDVGTEHSTAPWPVERTLQPSVPPT